MSAVYDTLFLPFFNGQIDAAGKDVLFVNAAPCAGLDLLSQSRLIVQQFFKPAAQSLQSAGYQVHTSFPDKAFDCVIIACPKGKMETQHWIAKGTMLLREGGFLICAAENEAGGKRLKKWLNEAGFQTVSEDMKNKARVCRATKTEKHDCEEWFQAGELQTIAEDKFFSQPGIFGWDKIDKGSEILPQHIPADLSGTGADFGCGYGYLSSFLLQRNPAIQELIAIDADFRAIRAAEKNLEKYNITKRFLWEDLTRPLPHLQDMLDWIVMNPPFHEGKTTDSDIGREFIVNAHKALRSGGVLYMVANAHLPYEDLLAGTYTHVEKKHEGGGFKVFAATK